MKKRLAKKEEIEKNENIVLGKYATKSSDINFTKRKYNEKEDEFRTEFQRDRDRIIHSKSFRRLMGKTQVIVSSYGDHYRTRFAHTIEVAQISRDISRTLRLNEDLAESIALAHDLGHTPFGHAGESALNEIMQKYGKFFEHNNQSLRVVTELEKKYTKFFGLNLTKAVRDGLVKHKSFFDETKNLYKNKEKIYFSNEAKVVNIADEIAYLNHDFDDGFSSGFLDFNDIKKLQIFEMVAKNITLKIEKKYLCFAIVSNFMKIMIKDIYQNFEKEKKIAFSQNFFPIVLELKNFLYKKFYYNSIISAQSENGKKIIKKIFYHYLKKNKFDGNINKIKDFIAGMTDSFAINIYKKL